MSTLVADADLSVLIDSLLERGLVRDIGVWTDEEAEKCRLMAFAAAQSRGRLSDWGRLESYESGAVRYWVRRDGDSICTTERFFGFFDPPDFALEVPVSESGRRLLFPRSRATWSAA